MDHTFFQLVGNTPVTWLIIYFNWWLTHLLHSSYFLSVGGQNICYMAHTFFQFVANTCYLSPLSLLFYFKICVRIVFQTDERSVNFHKRLYRHDYTPQYVLETAYFTSCREEKSWSTLWNKLLLLLSLRFAESESRQ
jgi:hypothetical protein